MYQVVIRHKNAVWAAQLLTVAPLLLTISAAGLWLTSLTRIRLREMNDLGLVSVLPVSFFAALILLTLGFVLSLRQPQKFKQLHLAPIVLLVFILFGTTAVVENMPRFVTAWTHLGFAEYISRTGETATGLDARFSWPIFFSLTSFVTEAAGLENGLPFLSWAHVYFNLLYLGPLLLIYRSLTDDERLVQLGLWLFYIGNWIGQDYFSPQGFNYFLHLLILGLLLKWFQSPPPTASFLATAITHLNRLLGQRIRHFDKIVNWIMPDNSPDAPGQPRQRAGMVIIIAILFAVIASSHQLTPFALLGSVAALVVFDRCSIRTLPILMAILIGAWISYMTVDFLSGHLETLTGDMGQVSGVVSANVSSRFQGSPEHALVLYSKVVMALAIWGLAFLGGVRRLWNGHRDVTAVLLAGVPFALLALQSYGGEMMMRVYLFALPWMIFFLAGLFYPTPKHGRSWMAGLIISLASLVLLAGFLITRYGNERMDYITASDVAAVRYLHHIAPPDSLLVSATFNLPWRLQNVDQFDFETLDDEFEIGDLPSLMADSKDAGSEAYLILTHSQQTQAELFLGWEPGRWEQLEETLLASDQFRLIYRNNDAMIFILTGASQEAAP